jgi:hypothetical protein
MSAIWLGLRRTAFIGGLGLSAIAAIALLFAVYFSGTAPRLPSSAAALETLKTGGGWPPSVTAKTLDSNAAPSTAEATNVSLMPRSFDPSEAPPIDISDLPPPERRTP